MLNQKLFFPLLIFFIFYLTSLILLACLSKQKSKEKTLSDFYLGNRNFGFIVLFLTFYATQYSGNSMIGFTAKAYRSGFWVICTVTCMIASVAGIFLLAPRAYSLSRKYNFITPIDFLNHQYKSKLLSFSALIILLYGLATYMVSNLKALGHLMEFISQGYLSFESGIIFMALILVLYESIGGLRSVAYTDVLQGIMILIGCIGICVSLYLTFGSLSDIAPRLQEINPNHYKIPSLDKQSLWISTILLCFFGIPLNPHSIQRIYASKSKQVLKKSIIAMSFMPFFTTLLVIILGLYGLYLSPDLSKAESEKITLIVIEKLINKNLLATYISVVFIGSVLAAIMSTIDSALLSFSSMLTHDAYRHVTKNQTQKHLTYVGKLLSWITISILVLFAIYSPASIWRLVIIKLEIMCQLSPAFFLAALNIKVPSKKIVKGLIVGILITLAIIFRKFSGFEIPTIYSNVHAGIWGLFCNCIVLLPFTKIVSSIYSKAFPSSNLDLPR